MSPALSPIQVFKWLQGEWNFVRLVPGHARMTGGASITSLAPEIALYEEHARIQLDAGGTLVGQRRYLYTANDQGFDILFDDYRSLFHSLRFVSGPNGALTAKAIHLCAADRYDSRYEITDNDSFTVQHTVTGPRKRYTIHTACVRPVSGETCGEIKV